MSCMPQNQLNRAIAVFHDDSNGYIKAHYYYLAKKHSAAILMIGLN